ncbi:helix-turn-helix transcriptional regulator [Oxalobacteraceae bacterium]|nr:helix-turn-helix transcriptional regulator [Oxalobacteraceae bacterium]
MHSDLSWLLSQPFAAATPDGAVRMPFATAQLVAVQAYRLRAVACDTPLLIILLEGTKLGRLGEERHEAGVGQFMLVHRALQFDVENLPAPSGLYRALAVAFPWRVIALARSMLAEHAGTEPVQDASVSVGALAAVQAPLRAYLEADPADAMMVDHLALGLLLALARAGHHAFRLAQDPSVAARVRQMIAAAPAQDWKAAHVEQALQFSSATLRRRLQDEGTSFRAVLLEARLHAGLTLLQTTGRSVKAVAGACGYSSVPSFSTAFIERFGVPPSAVGRLSD